jgi:hypothetical protein
MENHILNHTEENKKTNERTLKLSKDAQIYLKNTTAWAIGLSIFGGLCAFLILVLRLYGLIFSSPIPFLFLFQDIIASIIFGISSAYLFKFAMGVRMSIKLQDSKKLGKSMQYLFLNFLFFFFILLLLISSVCGMIIINGE